MSALSDWIVAEFAPYLYWQMNEASGVVQDSSGNARHADSTTPTTYGVTAGVPAAIEKAMSIIPSGKSVVRNAEYQGAGAQSWCVYFKPVTGANKTLHTIFSNGESYSGDVDGMGLFYDATNQRARVLPSGGGAAFTANNIVLLDTWYSLVAVFDGNLNYKLYVNGVERLSYDDAGAFDAADGNDLRIGVVGGDTVNTHPYGQFAHLFMVERALTQPEAESIYEAGINGNIPGGASGMAGQLLPCAIC